MALSLLSLLSGLLLVGRSIHAQETATVSLARPSQEAALAFLNEVWDHLPEEDPVAIYLSCTRPDCEGQVPVWFSRASWEEGLGEGGNYAPADAVGVSPERVSELRRLHPAPADLAAGIARELAAVGQTVSWVLLVYPNLREERLELSWQLVNLSETTVRDPLGRLTVRLPPPPPPLPPPPGPPWRTRPVVWVGAGLLAAGGVAAVSSSAALLDAAQDPRQRALTTTAALGWIGVMVGGSMMVVPAIHTDHHHTTTTLMLRLRR